MLCGFCFRKDRMWLPYSLLFFFTCIYHAYGILIAILPLVYFSIVQRKIDWNFGFIVLVCVLFWGYYAAYNSFGWTPNAIQTQSNSFQYMPLKGFFMSLFTALTGGGVIMYGLSSILLIRLFSKKSWLFFGILILLPILLVMGVSLKTNAWILPRYFIWVMPWFIMFCVKQMEEIKCQEIKVQEQKVGKE